MEETELNSKINSNLFAPNKVSKQSTKRVKIEKNVEEVVFNLHEN